MIPFEVSLHSFFLNWRRLTVSFISIISTVCVNGPLETAIADPQDGEMPYFTKSYFPYEC